jgi:hypothetical protein
VFKKLRLVSVPIRIMDLVNGTNTEMEYTKSFCVNQNRQSEIKLKEGPCRIGLQSPVREQEHQKVKYKLK